MFKNNIMNRIVGVKYINVLKISNRMNGEKGNSKIMVIDLHQYKFIPYSVIDPPKVDYKYRVWYDE